MKNSKSWHSTKFIYNKRGKLVGSKNLKELSISSRLIANIVASFYDENIKKYVNGKLLDLGCGKVPLFEAYKKFASENVCVDWSNTLHKNKYLDFECDLTKALPIENEEFNTIILSDVLEHIPQPEFLWSEMSRVLKKGGKILMNVPFHYRLHEAPYDYYRYTEYALRRFAKLSGFKIITLSSIGGIPEIIADILAKYLKGILIVGNLIANIIQNITLFFVKTSIGKRISRKTGIGFPLGYFLVAEKISSKIQLNNKSINQ